MGAPGVDQRLLEAVGQQVAIGQVGQRIGVGLVLERFRVAGDLDALLLERRPSPGEFAAGGAPMRER
jgi:hypothetical protein